MAVSKKSRRTVTVGGRLFVWYVDRDGEYYDKAVLHIISDDKRLILTVPLDAPKPYAINKSEGRWRRYLLPFEMPTSVTPKCVAEIIGWAESDSGAVEVQWNGRDFLL